jgi:type 1 fimbria pilin
MRHLALFTGVTIALLTPLASMAAGAASSASLQVKGTITPASCNVSIVGDAAVDLGTVNLSDFTAGQDLELASKTSALSVVCDGAAAQFRLKATDSGLGVSTPGDNHYSLGRSDQSGKNVANGYFKLSIDAAQMTDNTFVLKSKDKGEGKVWAAPVTGIVPFDHIDKEAFAFAASSASTEPAKLASLIVPLKIDAVLAKDPVVTEELEFGGTATIEILY